MKQSRPCISIVLPTRNGARFLREAIKSCLDQTYEALELIVVDDASTDNTPEILNDFRHDRRFRILRSERRLGLPAALNLGFRNAGGDFLTWTSDDNLYEPQALSRLASELQAHARCEIVYADACKIDAQGVIVGPDATRAPEYLVEFNCVGACFLYRRSVMDRVGLYSEDLFLAEDYDFFLRAYLAGCRMRRVAEVLYRYRVHEHSLGSTHGKPCVDEVAKKVRLRLLTPWRREWIRLRRRIGRVMELLTRGK